MVLYKRLVSAIAASLLLTILIGVAPVEAKVTGKISGAVIDVATGEPIEGATVSVVGTTLATKTDEDGEYFIIGVPVGQYHLVVTHVGFERHTAVNVRVLIDLTTPVDFDLQEATVELANEVIVRAQAPLIQKDLTASRIIFTEERLRNLPNISSVQSILTNYPGVVNDANNQLHIRGGRSGQLSYYYDGFSVQDPFTATSGIRIMPSSLIELSLTSGGFGAEYGEALSGIVSAVTREGSSEYHGRARVAQGATHPYDVTTGKWGKLKSVVNRTASFDVSGPMPGLDARNYTFFAAGEYLRNDGYLPHNWMTQYTMTGKLAMQPIPKLKLKTNFTYNEADGAAYEHRDVNGVSYDFNLDGLPIFDRRAYLVGLTGNYMISNRAILSITFNRFNTRTTSGPAHLKGLHWSEWPGYAEGTIDDDNYGNNPDFTDPMQATGFTVGDDFEPTYGFRETTYNSFSSTFITQFNKTNQFKTGFEIRRYSVDWDFKQFYNTNPYGEKYTSQPSHASFFVEDKLEYADFVINLGIRYDYRNADIAYNYTPDAETATYRDAVSKSRFSPRLGVSFPISEKSAMHFNYGVYYQDPRYVYLYTNLQGDRSSGLPILGNPDLDPEATTSYELGVDHLIGSSLRLDVTAYYKDVDDLVTTREVGRVSMSPVSRYVNGDYGSVTGLDVSLEKLPISGYLSGSISYGYLIAKGNGSNANEPYYTYLTSSTDTLAPVSDFALDFDQRHTLNAVIDYRVPADWSADLFGLRIPGSWGLSVVGYFGSGLPFSRSDASGNLMGERNASRLPASYSVDMRFNKDFNVGGSKRLVTWFVEVDNIFDRRNVLDVYSRTGKPDDDDIAVVLASGTDAEQAAVAHFDDLYDHDPQNFSPPRTVRTGLEYSF
jgi:outer membrane receptor protein involved in Fe transport